MSNEYHHDEQGRARIILPKKGYKGKIIQVEIKKPENPLFIFGEEIHAKILKNTLKRFGIDFKGEYISGDGLFNKERFVPYIEGDNYRLVGAGKSKREGEVIIFGDASADYGLSINEDIFNRCTRQYIPKEIKFDFRISID